MSTPVKRGAAVLGASVDFRGKRGKVAWEGDLDISGKALHSLGIVLDEAKGLHDGSLFGKHYFTCPDKHGVFAKASDVTFLTPAKPAKPLVPYEESELKEKAKATNKEEMEAEAEKLERCIHNPDLLKSKGRDLAEKATQMALALEEGTTEDLERMVKRILDAVNSGMESDTFKKARATAGHMAEESVAKATEIAQVAEKKLKEAHLEEMVGAAKGQAQAAQEAAAASLKSAAETISSTTAGSAPSKDL